MEKLTSSSIPFGYLFNLAIKNFSKQQQINSKYLLGSLAELLEMARHYIALLQLQSYNIYVGMFLNHETFIDHIYNNVLYDNIMLHKQFNPRYIPRNIRGMLREYFNQINGCQFFGLPFEELISIINYLLNHPSRSSKPSVTCVPGQLGSIPRRSRQIRIFNVLKYILPTRSKWQNWQNRWSPLSETV